MDRLKTKIFKLVKFSLPTFASPNLVALKDDKHFYPSYYVVPVIWEAFLKLHPEVGNALAPLADLIDNETMPVS
ncbi:glycine betaine ABC transporter substrate-binding protein [Coxiella-like endosymbiont]|uniref:glycine betaine ABC transporter substrate-binding protein n=1 Tax=Coxiella-like endosymbiont TaxID=1592897 RepID=UPI00272B3380|nr:glycine betaine ABC transporter substrate-binding protein [Coxiella-like endosymbiont]